MFYRDSYHRDLHEVRRSMEADGIRVAKVVMLDGTRITVDLDDPLSMWQVV